MKRLAILTVGKTHSGKTTFAYALEQALANSLVIDQDNHAGFINSHYTKLTPKQGPNILKLAISQTILDYAINHSPYHLIVSNANLEPQGRAELIEQFRKKGFTIVLVHFALSDEVLHERVKKSSRPTHIFRSDTSFEAVLFKQQAMASKLDPNEADYIFEIKDNSKAASLIQKIVNLTF